MLLFSSLLANFEKSRCSNAEFGFKIKHKKYQRYSVMCLVRFLPVRVFIWQFKHEWAYAKWPRSWQWSQWCNWAFVRLLFVWLLGMANYNSFISVIELESLKTSATMKIKMRKSNSLPNLEQKRLWSSGSLCHLSTDNDIRTPTMS